MFDSGDLMSTGPLLLVAGISGLLLGGLLVARRMSGEPDTRSFRATDRSGTVGRLARLAADAAPWLLGVVLAGSLLWLAAIALGLVPG